MLRFENLIPEVRLLMAEEVQLSSADGTLYASPRLSSRGKIDYLGLLADAVANYDEAWLTRELRKNSRIKTMELRLGKEVSVPVTAAETLAEGEFNRFYIRALCLRAGEDGIKELTVFRAKPVRKVFESRVLLENMPQLPIAASGGFDLTDCAA